MEHAGRTLHGPISLEAWISTKIYNFCVLDVVIHPGLNLNSDIAEPPSKWGMHEKLYTYHTFCVGVIVYSWRKLYSGLANLCY